MEKEYNENCKAQALTIKWICRMLEEHQVRQYLKIIDFLPLLQSPDLRHFWRKIARS